MSGSELEEELRDGVQASRGSDSLDSLRPMAVLHRLGVNLPPTLNFESEASLPPDPGGTVSPSAKRMEVPALGMDVWAGQNRLGFAPTLDIDDAEALTTAAVQTVESSEQIGRFAVVGELGSGGMGRVVEAVDPDLGRHLAIKVVRDPSRMTPARLARFVSEAQLTAQLSHPNIVPVHELGVTPEGQLYYAMKKVEGVSLAGVLARLRAGDPQLERQWSLRRLLGAFVKVCLAVGYAHRRGVIHRDLKPDNIMLGEFGEVLLLDWGLARLIDEAEPDPEGEADPVADRAAPLTRVGALSGTPGYLSPEQARGERGAIGPPSDVWSLGAILFELLTGSTPFPGEKVVAYLRRVVEEEVEDPRDRAPDRRISSELAGVCLSALRLDPRQRYRDARELAQAVEDWLEGARRRSEARGQLQQASDLWKAFRSARLQVAAAEQEVAELEGRVQPWTPIEDKRDLLAAREESRQLQLAGARAWGEAVAAGERALAHDPGNKQARAFLARAYWARMQEAERRGDRADQALYELRVRAYDDGPLRALLRGDGALSLRTDPRGAEAIAERFEDDGVRLRLVEERRLGPTPLEDVPLGRGSWRVRLRLPDRPEAVYPVQILRGGHWHGGGVPVPLPREVPEGFCYVPAGPAQLGSVGGGVDTLKPERVDVPGFLAARDPVTVGEYLAFLDALHADDPEAAWARVPRQTGALSEEPDRYLPRPVGGRYTVPEADAQGDTWDLRFPVFAVSAHDAEAYAAWRSRVTGRPHRLLTEIEWEKAARGVDGRTFPWGEAREPTLCWSRDGQEGRPQPRVVGACPDDVSPYGLRDVAGGVTEWTSTPAADGTRRICRGGSWASTLRQCELANRLTTDPAQPFTYLGFRLALDL